MKRFLKSINSKILLLLVAIAVPILTVSIFLYIHENNSMKLRLLETEQSELELSVYSLTTSVRLLNDQILYQLVSGESSFTRLEQRELGVMQDDVEYYSAVRNASKQLEAINSIFPFLDSAFLYYPKQDLFLNGKRNTDISDQVIAFADEHPRTSSDGWMLIETKDGWYGLIIYYLKHGYIGSWFSYNDLMSGMGTVSKQYREGTILAVTSDGLVLNNSGSAEKADIAALLKTSGSVNADHVIEKVDDLNVYLIKYIDHGALPSGSRYYLIIISLVLLLLLISIMSGVFVFIQTPIRKLSDGIEKIGNGDADYRIPIEKGFSSEFIDISQRVNEMLDNLNDAKIRIYQQELEQQETKLRYLSQQIQPHFILNSLNTVYNYSRRDVETTRKIILLLVAYYRYVVNVESQYVLLSEELSHIENYLSLQKIRMDDRLEYSIECPPEYEAILIPPFLIVCFIGNSLKYGADEEDCIHISIVIGKDAASRINITLRDQGEGFPDEILEAIEDSALTESIHKELGIGIRNSIERLRLLYHDRAEISLYNDGGAVVRIAITI